MLVSREREDHLYCRDILALLMAGETGGGDREGPFSPGPSNSISWVGLGVPNIHIMKMGPFTSL